MFRSLRAKLIASYALIIAICLFLVSAAVTVLLQEYQRQIKLNQMADAALTLALQVRWLEPRIGLDGVGEFLREQAAEGQIRILIVDAGGIVLDDTAGRLRGQHLAFLNNTPPAGQRGLLWGTYHGPDGDGLFMVAALPPRGPLNSPRLLGRPFYVVVAVPERHLTAAWLELLPRLGLAGALSFVVSTVIALLLSRSISRPLARITRAAEEIAHGHYDQHIPVNGRDEVARLAAAFNTMARAVGQSQKTLRDFLANVSHELKTPLTAIQGFSQAMLDGTLRDPAAFQEGARIIHEEADRMRRLVEDLLLLSKLESGQLHLRQEPVDLAALAQVCARRVRWLADLQTVALALDLAPVPQVSGDPSRLEMVLGNLLDNALKHTPPGGRVRVSLRTEDPWVVLEVFNSGSFIPPEDLPHIFERFYQARNRSGREGSGLGLAIVREIVQAHGGTVVAQSDPASGTTFTVRLPRLAHQPSGSLLSPGRRPGP